MRARLTTTLLFAVSAVCAQKPAASEKAPVEGQGPVIRTTVNYVVVPVTVTDKNSKFVNGLEGKDFKLFDNNKSQDIRLDVSYVPVSLVVAIQANSSVEVVLPKIKPLGPLLENLVIGESGEAAILAFDHRVRLLQDFTSDGRLFTRALQGLQPGSTTAAMIDAVFDATRLLRRRPTNHRRILLLISEAMDKGSEGRLREALLEAQVHNIIIYSININRAVTSLTERPQPPRWDHLPPGARPIPSYAPQTPTVHAQVSGVQGQSLNFTPLFIEIFRQVKGIFITNPLEVFTRYTGGREYSFLKTETLQRVVSDLGEELHSQYILSYTPNNIEEGGWHDIRVEVSRFNMTIRTRPGYWMASVPQ